MEGDDKPLDALKKRVDDLQQRVDEQDAQLREIKVMLEDNGYKVDARREH